MRYAAMTVVLGLLIGCAAKTSVSETTAQGQLALSTFPEVPSAVIARTASGTVRSATPSATGAFVLALPKGDSYSIGVVMPSRSVVIGMPRSSGAIDRSFKVSSAGVRIELGVVRYRAAGATDPVAAGASSAACEDGANGAQGADGECENGVDSTTKAACSDGAGTADTLQPDAEMALPEHDAPTDASGCDQSGEDGAD
jgi:hypothetical protein